MKNIEYCELIVVSGTELIRDGGKGIVEEHQGIKGVKKWKLLHSFVDGEEAAGD